MIQLYICCTTCPRLYWTCNPGINCFFWPDGLRSAVVNIYLDMSSSSCMYGSRRMWFCLMDMKQPFHLRSLQWKSSALSSLGVLQRTGWTTYHNTIWPQRKSKEVVLWTLISHPHHQSYVMHNFSPATERSLNLAYRGITKQKLAGNPDGKPHKLVIQFVIIYVN